MPHLEVHQLMINRSTDNKNGAGSGMVFRLPATRLFLFLKKFFYQEPIITEMVIPVYAG